MKNVMDTNISEDFTYKFYRNILSVIKNKYEPHFFFEAEKVIKSADGNPKIFIRHDVDLDLKRAVNIAKIEKEAKINSCYMIMTNCPFYSLKKKTNRLLLLEFIKLGHEIGLHFNVDKNINVPSNIKPEVLEGNIILSCKLLEDITGTKINTISFHRPLPQFLRGPLYIADRVNAYSAELMDWYLSDSKGVWREGNPIPMLENPKKKVLQLLVHPIWWGRSHKPAAERLQVFYENKTRSFNNEKTRTFDNALTSHLSIFRSKKRENKYGN
jgi:hypothetical protein